jgi:hypothetical protein
VATREEERVDRNEESAMGGFTADAFSAFQTLIECFSSYTWTRMSDNSSNVCVFWEVPRFAWDDRQEV